MTAIPTLEIIFALLVVILRPDTASFTVTRGYSPDDPITWTRLEDRSTWRAVSQKDVAYGIWHLEGSVLSVTVASESKTTDLRKYIKGDLDVTAPQVGMEVLGHKLKVTQEGNRFEISTADGGLFESPVTAIKRTK